MRANAEEAMSTSIDAESCTKCDARGVGTCDCWVQCSCGWTAEKNRPCRNQGTTDCSTKAQYKQAHRLTDSDMKILGVLDTRGGTQTCDVASRVKPQFGHSKRTHSGAVRSWLIALEKLGLVKRLDNQKPVCWLRIE